MRTEKRKKALAVVVAVLAVAAVVAAVWHPWDAGEIVDGDAERNPEPAGEMAEVPTVPAEWVSAPDDFPSRDEAERYEREWHTNGELRGKYSVKTVTTDSGAQYVAGELGVYVPLGTSDDDADSIARELGGSVAEIKDSEVSGHRRILVVFADDADMEALAERASGMQGVEDADVNFVGRAFEGAAAASTAGDPLSASQTYLSQSGFSDAWDEARCEGSVRVAVLDSGIDYDHEDLAGNIDFANAWDAILDAPAATASPDYCGHGTAAAGVIAAECGNGKGISGASFNATIIPARVIDETGHYYYYDLNDALDYVLSLGADEPDVINMSLGGDAFSSVQLGKVNEASVTHGIVCVAAVGNYSTAGSTYDAVQYPAGYDNVIGVGAVDGYNMRCDFSNVNASVDLCALGQGVYTTTDPTSEFGQGRLYADRYVVPDDSGEDETRLISGTSFAAPQVAAAAALLKAQNPYWGPMQIEERLEQTARDLGAAGRDDYYGWGLLDAAAAVGWEEPNPDPEPSWGSSEEPVDVIGIFEPSDLWKRANGDL